LGFVSEYSGGTAPSAGIFPGLGLPYSPPPEGAPAGLEYNMGGSATITEGIVCDVHNVPLATNPETGKAVLKWVEDGIPDK